MELNEQIKSIMINTVRYIQGAIPLIEELSDEFYRGPEQSTWIKLQQLIEGIDWINSGAEAIVNCKQDFGKANEYIKSVTEMESKLLEFEGAMKNSDMVLIGDLLSYEIIPMLESIKDTANDIVNSGVDGNAPN